MRELNIQEYEVDYSRHSPGEDSVDGGPLHCTDNGLDYVMNEPGYDFAATVQIDKELVSKIRRVRRLSGDTGVVNPFVRWFYNHKVQLFHAWSDSNGVNTRLIHRQRSVMELLRNDYRVH